MAGDEPVCRIAVAMLAPALGQHVLFLRLQHREPPDVLEIARKAGFGGYDRQGRGTGHGSALSWFAPVAAGCLGHPSPGAGDRDASLQLRSSTAVAGTIHGIEGRQKLRVRHIALMAL